MTASKFCHKPAIVEAMQFLESVEGLTTEKLKEFLTCPWKEGRKSVFIDAGYVIFQADVGDWIVKYPDNSFMVCNPESFEAMFEPVEEGDES